MKRSVLVIILKLSHFVTLLKTEKNKVGTVFKCSIEISIQQKQLRLFCPIFPQEEIKILFMSFSRKKNVPSVNVNVGKSGEYAKFNTG